MELMTAAQLLSKEAVKIRTLPRRDDELSTSVAGYVIGNSLRYG